MRGEKSIPGEGTAGGKVLGWREAGRQQRAGV